MYPNSSSGSDGLYWMNAIFATWMTVTWIRILASILLDLKDRRPQRASSLLPARPAGIAEEPETARLQRAA